MLYYRREIWTVGQYKGFCWPVHDVLYASPKTKIVSQGRTNTVVDGSTGYSEWANPIVFAQCRK